MQKKKAILSPPMSLVDIPTGCYQSQKAKPLSAKQVVLVHHVHFALIEKASQLSISIKPSPQKGFSSGLSQPTIKQVELRFTWRSTNVASQDYTNNLMLVNQVARFHT